MVRFQDNEPYGPFNIIKAILRSPLPALSLLVMLVIWGSAGAADTDNFYSQAMTPGGRVISITPLQYDGVGPNEVALVLRGEEKGFRLQIHRETAPRNYESTPLLSIEIPASVFAMQAVDYDGDNHVEIALLGMESMYVVDFDNGAYSAQAKQLMTFDRLFSIPEPDLIIGNEFLFDLDGDKKSDAVLPCWEGIRILKRNGDAFTPIRTVRINHGTVASQTPGQIGIPSSASLGLALPSIVCYDVNSDRSKDILVASGNGMVVCYQVGNFQFAETPSQLLEVRAAFLDNLKFMAWGFGDFNGDKVIDYCRVFTQGQNDEFKTFVEFYLATGQNGFSQRASRRIVLDEYCLGLSVADLNGNGSSAAIVATVSVSPTSLMKALLVKRMQVGLNIFQANGGVMAEQATAVKKVGCGIDFFNGNIPTRFMSCAHADFDRDKYSELVTLNDDDEIEIYRGAKDAQFSDKPVITRETLRCNWLDATDLNTDGKADLIVHSTDETGRDQITFLWSK